jgi:RNA polymerase subunit RPABC4/transcription elongation factor Spt4
MVEPTLPADPAISESVCPWCSASLTPETAVCPSCGAILTAEEERDLPGITAVDANSIRRTTPSRSRNRLLSWISGEYPEEAAAAEGDAQAIAPPDPVVQREILRLELEAEVANLQAEADAMMSDAVEEGRVIAVPEELRQFASIESTSDESTDETPSDGTPSDGTAAEEATTAEEAPPA